LLHAYLDACLLLALLVMVPGPDFAVVARFAVAGRSGDGRRAAYGVVLGLLGWGLATALGLAALLAASAALFDVVRLLGAVYLLALGLLLLVRSAGGEAASAEGPAGSDARPFRTGLTTNLLNPKIAVFYTAVLPSLVPGGVAAAPWLALLVLTHVALSFLWLAASATLLSRGRSRLGRPPVRRALEGATGAVLVGFGLELARSSR
jgi:threonine/homoserine/homoserine lactone efflux protein